MNTSNSPYDVAIVGYGPAGEVLASTLGAAGLRVLVVERWPQPYPLPRLTTLDVEVCRIVQATGVDVDRAFETTLVQESVNFVDAEGEPVASVLYPGKLGGWPSRVNMFQPDIEAAIAAKVESLRNVEVLRGYEAVDLWQDAQFAHLTIAPLGRSIGLAGPTAAPARTVKAHYVVGTDGARSFVRLALGVGMRDYDMHQRWLNFDAWALKPLPGRLKTLKIFMDPERPHMFMPIGTRGLRMEFRVMEGETDEAMCEPAAAWDFMQRKYGVGSDDVKLMRQVVYHYRTRMADRWRVGRVFLAGDAAHLMPPYMGQGACAAMRDAFNLGWKLVEVLVGRSGEALLDDYQAERQPHVEALMLGSDRISRFVNITDPAAAERRNLEMRQRGDLHPPGLPGLKAGVLAEASPGAGDFAPQSRLRRGNSEGRGDDVIGGGFQLWCRRDPAAVLGSTARAFLDKLGCRIAVFEQPDSSHAVQDLDGAVLACLQQHGADALLVRPDFYLFGSAKADALDTLVHELARRLHAKP